jgi:hypothetical protein
VHRGNIPWGRDAITEHVANLPDAGGEHPLADRHVRPNGRQEVAFAHQAPGVLHQVAQHGHRFRLQLAPPRAAPQLVVRALQVERAKVQSRDRRHPPSRTARTTSSKKTQSKLKARSGLTDARPAKLSKRHNSRLVVRSQVDRSGAWAPRRQTPARRVSHATVARCSIGTSTRYVRLSGSFCSFPLSLLATPVLRCMTLHHTPWRRRIWS